MTEEDGGGGVTPRGEGGSGSVGTNKRNLFQVFLQQMLFSLSSEIEIRINFFSLTFQFLAI